MALSTRPGSLTLLAVLNLVGGGLSVLFLFGALARIAMAAHGKAGHGLPPFAHDPLWLTWMTAGWSALRALMLVVSGIGLLRQAPLLGRLVANLYGVAALSMAWVGAAARAEHSDVVMVTVLEAFYPLVLMLWINVVVRDVWRAPAAPRSDLAGDGRVATGHIRLNMLLSLRQTLRGAAGPGFLLGYITSGLVVVLVLVELNGGVEQINGKINGQFTGDSRPRPVPGEWIASGTRWMLRTILHEEPPQPGAAAPSSVAWAHYLVSEHAPVTSFCWLILSVVVAQAAATASFNQISRDAAQRGFHFLLLRTSRRAIFLGRLLASALLAAAATLVLCVVATISLGLAQPGLAWGPHLAWCAWATAALLLTALPYVAFGMYISTLVDGGLMVLGTLYGLLNGVPILALVASSQIWEPLIWLINLLPAAVQFWLFSPSPWCMAGAAAACLGYSALFAWLGLRHFQARDL
jgi:hypothetical protein